MDRQAEGFEAALAADRYDSLARLAYADWLDERGEDDAAAEQRRRAAPGWAEADRRLRALAERCGETCTNLHGRGVRDEDLEWVPVTYDDLVRAGHDFLREGEFVRYGRKRHWEGERFLQRGSQVASNVLNDRATLRQFWEDWQVVTGVGVEGDKRGCPVGCSC